VIAMSIIAGVAKAAAGAKMLTRTRPTTWVFPKTKWTLVVMAVALLALLAAFAALIPASEAPNADHFYSAVSRHDQSRAAPQMSERKALKAYKKPPLSFIPNESQTDEAVRYYAQGAGYIPSDLVVTAELMTAA
jgi:hypothetical protein